MDIRDVFKCLHNNQSRLATKKRARSRGRPITAVRFEHFCNRTPVIGYHVIFTSIPRALMAYLAIFFCSFQNLAKKLRTL